MNNQDVSGQKKPIENVFNLKGSQTLFCVEVTNKEKIGPGGGLVEEGEMIQVLDFNSNYRD